MKKDTLEKQYRQITALYDMAEDLASTVESEFNKDPEAQLALVEPLITQIADAADTLSEEFIGILERPARKKTASSRIEAALRKIFMALEEYKNRLSNGGKKTLAFLANIADPVVDKIRNQAEKIVLIFLQLIELSLDRIMHKAEVESFKRVYSNSITPQLQPGH